MLRFCVLLAMYVLGCYASVQIGDVTFLMIKLLLCHYFVINVVWFAV